MHVCRVLFALLPVVALFGCRARSYNSSGGAKTLVWNSTQDWTPQLEAEFQTFIQRIGDARWAHNLVDRPSDLAEWKRFIGYDPGECVFLKDCIKNPKVNPLYSESDKALTIEADCGDVPAMLRGYFSYKKRLPFMYEWATEEPQGDHGIFPPTVIRNQQTLDTMNEMFTDIRNHQHAHFYRTPISVEHTDTYPVRVGRDTIKPGTVAYFSGGHAMMVFRIKPDGSVLVIQGHPGEPNGIPPSYFSVTTVDETTLPQDFYYKSGGFRNWRPYVKGSQYSFANTDGPRVVYENGQGLNYAPNKDLPDLDRGGTNFQKSYNVSGRGEVDFYDYLKSQLCDPAVCGKRKPSELRDMVFGICTTLKERQSRVESAVKAGLTRKSHPGVPKNVYDAADPWEAQSTPGFDTRIRSAFALAIRYMKETAYGVSVGCGGVDFRGSRAELLNLYQSYLDEAFASPQCRVSVAGETGSFTLGLKEINEKLYDMSFDPYHCPELRWGIKANCSPEQLKYYDAEVRIRNVSTPGARPEAGGMDGNGLPEQLSRGPSEPPALEERNLQQALNELKRGSSAPNPNPAPISWPKECVVDVSAGNTANIRNEPNANGTIVVAFPKGAGVRAVGEDETGKWYSIEYRLQGVNYGVRFGNPVWVSKSLVTCR